MKHLRRIICLVCIMTALQVSAAWTGYGVVTSVTSHNGLHNIETTIDATTCAGTGNFWWPTDDPDAKDMLSISLAALMSGKRVRLVHTPETPDCRFDTFNKATHIAVYAD